MKSTTNAPTAQITLQSWVLRGTSPQPAAHVGAICSTFYELFAHCKEQKPSLRWFVYCTNALQWDRGGAVSVKLCHRAGTGPNVSLFGTNQRTCAAAAAGCDMKNENGNHSARGMHPGRVQMLEDDDW